MSKTKLITLSLLPFAVLQIANASSPVYVDASYSTTHSDGHVFSVDAFSTIQEGIDAVSEDGIIYVKKGTYTESLTITKSLSLAGLVEQGTTGATSDAPSINGGDNVATILVRGSSTPIRVSLYNLHIKNGNHGILVVQSARMLVTGNTIDGYKKNGITFGSKIIRGNGKISGVISSNNIKGAGPTDTLSQNGIQVADDSSATITDNTISNNIFTRSGKVWATGIFINNSTGNKILKNILINNQAGINILQASGNTLEGNSILGNSYTEAGIMVTNFDDALRNATKNVISKNTITGGYTGIWASYASGNKYVNNIISNSTQYGIYLWDTDSNTLSNNVISSIHSTGKNGFGIALNGGDAKNTSAGSDYNYVSNNTVTDSDSPLYVANNSTKNAIVRNGF